MSRKIARITQEKKLLLANEVVESNAKTSLNSDGRLDTDEIIEYPAELEGGRNLIVRTNELENYWIPLDGSVSPCFTGYVNAVMNDYIAVMPGEVLTFTKTESVALDGGFFRWRWFDAEMNYIARTADKRNEFQWIVPENTYYIQVSYPMDAFPKIERGNKATDWTPAPEDLGLSYSDDIDSFGTKLFDGRLMVSELIEDCILEPLPDTYIDVYGFGRLVYPPDGRLNQMQTENTLSLDTELPLIYFSTLEYHVVNISNVFMPGSIIFYHHNIIERISGVYNFFDSRQSLVSSKNIDVDDNNKSYIEDNERVFQALPHTGSGTNYKTIEETPAGKLGYYLRIISSLAADAEVEGVITVREGSSVGDIIYRDSFRLLTEGPSCYLTTAMVGYFGKDDDGIELTAMRKLRSHSGYKYQDVLAEYYQVSPIIIRGIEQSEDKDYYYHMIKEVVDNIVIWVADEEWEKAETAYLDLYYYLKEKFGGD